MLEADDLTSFQPIAFNEIFEIAFFTDLLFNVTNNVTGFEVSDRKERQKLVNALVAIQATEELHADSTNAILSNNNIAAIQPCAYQFPTTTLMDALNLAATFSRMSSLELFRTSSSVLLRTTLTKGRPSFPSSALSLVTKANRLDSSET